MIAVKICPYMTYIGSYRDSWQDAMAMAAASKAIDDLPQDHLESGHLLWTKWFEAPSPSSSSCFATFSTAVHFIFCSASFMFPFKVGTPAPREAVTRPDMWDPKGARKRPASVFVDVGKFFSAFIALHLALEVHDRNRSTTCDLWLKTLKDLKKFCRAARKGDDACCKVGIHPETSCKQLWTHAWKYHQPNWAIQELDGVRGSCQSMPDALFSCGIPWNKCRRLAQCECLHRPLNPQDDQWMGKCVF